VDGTTTLTDSVSTAQSPPVRYVPGLDGLRAVSIVLVMLSHAGLGHVVPGGLGVTIFFAISGFLITTQIKDEIGRTGTLNLRQFYLRRLLRLAPALLVYIAIMTPIATWLGASISLDSLLAALFYVANYWWLYVGFPHGSPFPILWSLSIEEQYYVVFPLVMLLFLPKPRSFALAVMALAALALIWRLTLAMECGATTAPYALCGLPPHPDMPEGARIYLATDTRFDSILAGALAAILASSTRWRACFASAPTPWVAGLMLLLALAIRSPLFRDTLRYTIESAASAALVFHIAYSVRSPARAVLACKPLVQVGKLSYSLYLYHFASRLIISWLHGSFDWKDPAFYAFFALSFVLAALSYRLVERPMLNVRRRFGAQAT
jgi:peptidoglycan/LPS O-acetylase OafA/YrhL